MPTTPQRRRTDGRLDFRMSRDAVKETDFVPIADIAPLTEMRQLIDDANRAMMDYETAAREYNAAATRELELEAQRHLIKQSVVSRIMEDGKVAATNAEKQSACDTDYLTHLGLIRDAVKAKNAAHSGMVSAQMRQQIALIGVRVLMGCEDTTRGIL